MSVISWLKWPAPSRRVPRNRRLPDFFWIYVVLEVTAYWTPAAIGVVIATDWSVGVKVAACIALLPIMYVVLRVLHHFLGP